jgi:hypothetical protein
MHAGILYKDKKTKQNLIIIITIISKLSLCK